VSHQHDIPGGAAWSLRLRRHRELTLTALGDDANAAMLLFAAEDPLERLNVPDTLKAQMSARIAPPLVLMSDMGRALASVTGSSLDWHDAITGHSAAARGGLLDELWKHGLGPRDLHATVNWFAKAAPAGDERGTLTPVPGHARSGDWVTLRAELDVLVILAVEQPSAVRAAVAPVAPAAADDPSRAFRAESARALAETERSLD
jgi:uncharacterized protein YcgI (DUF1989 family)